MSFIEGTEDLLRNRCAFVFFQAEDGIRDLVRSRGLGDVYKRQQIRSIQLKKSMFNPAFFILFKDSKGKFKERLLVICLLYTSDAADERSSVDLGGRRIIKKKKRCIIQTVWPYF